MKEWDIENPTDDLSLTGLQMHDDQRAKHLEMLQAEAQNYQSQLWRFISDAAASAMDLAVKEIDRQAEDQKYANEAGVRRTAQLVEMSTSRINAPKYGDGVAYLMNRQQEDARLSADYANRDTLTNQILGRQRELDEFKTSIADEPQTGKVADQNREKIKTAEAEINQLMRERLELQQSINARTQEFTQIGLSERLEGAARSWAENSGAMDTWGKRAENMVAPALDQLTSGFTNFFTAFATGQQSFGAALRDMLASFADFVVQMIMQSVALEAVKWILGAFGVNTGPTIAYDTSGMYTGGEVTVPGKYKGGVVSPVNDNPYPGLYSGGRARKILNGGRVNQGTPTRDSALYELAEGEFVMRNKSVNDLGLGFMNAINDHGSAGLAKMQGAGSAFTNIQAPKQETNVYVVSEKEAKQLGPNDVLVTVQKDILQNGTTKKLIRQVAQGG